MRSAPICRRRIGPIGWSGNPRSSCGIYRTRPEARKTSVEFFTMSESTIANYLAIAVLPDRGRAELSTTLSITQLAGSRPIAKRCDAKNPEAVGTDTLKPVAWLGSRRWTPRDRRLAVDMLDSMTGQSTIEALDAELEKRKEEATCGAGDVGYRRPCVALC